MSGKMALALDYRRQRKLTSCLQYTMYNFNDNVPPLSTEESQPGVHPTTDFISFRIYYPYHFDCSSSGLLRRYIISAMMLMAYRGVNTSKNALREWTSIRRVAPKARKINSIIPIAIICSRIGDCSPTFQQNSKANFKYYY